MPGVYRFGAMGCEGFSVLLLLCGLDGSHTALIVGEAGTTGEERHQRTVAGDTFQTDPRLDGGSTPCGVDQANGNVLVGTHLASEEVGDSREVGGGLWSTCRPC